MRGWGTCGRGWAVSKEAYSAERRKTASRASVNSPRSGVLPPPPLLPPPPVWNSGHLVYSARKACGVPVGCRSAALLLHPWQQPRYCTAKRSALPSGFASGIKPGKPALCSEVTGALLSSSTGQEHHDSQERADRWHGLPCNRHGFERFLTPHLLKSAV